MSGNGGWVRTVLDYVSKSVSLSPKSAPREYPLQSGKEKTARRERVCSNTDPRFDCFNWNLLLLLLLLRNRNVIYPCGGGVVSNRSVIYLGSGGVV